MRKLIIIAASLVALAALTAGAANAAVSYDDQGFGSVDKGDVMPLFGWNEAAFQTIAKNPDAITFTNKSVNVQDYTWNCPGGITPHYLMTTTTFRPLAVTPVKNAAANKITGWNLNGLSTTDPGTTTRAFEGKPLACPGGAPFLGGFRLAGETTSNIVQVNGLDLPETPVAPVIDPAPAA
jgi:hypothetical protein